MQIDGSAFVISGAASRVGTAVARMIVDEGGRVGLIDLDEAAGRKLEAELGGSGVFHKADVAIPAEVERAIDVCIARFGGVDGAICCALQASGEKGREEPSGAALGRFAEALTVGLIGVFNVAQLAARAIGRRGLDEEGERGVIVMSALSTSDDAPSGRAAQAVVSAGVAAMAAPIAREWAPRGVRVVAIAGGRLEPAVPADVAARAPGALPAAPCAARPIELARLVRELCENRMMNGSVVFIDGAGSSAR
jgi:NAD(P)-dependent dehydrogenase (short-subunit alcohol dehydrogenase family)